MGDRAVFMAVEAWSEETPKYLVFYTHWGGHTLEANLADWLSDSRSRWGDGPYLNRMLFSRMIQGEVMGETGYGIMVNDIPGDIEHDVLVVDHAHLMVYRVPRKDALGLTKQLWTKVREKYEATPFEEFAKAKEKT